MSSLIGQTLGQYEVVALLGKGGMATVYRATQTSIGRDVAVKVIKPDLVESSGFIDRFKREASTIASLSHPHILKVFDYGHHGEVVYLVMELLKGGSLADRIKQGPLSLPDIEQVLTQVGSALDYAHLRGIIHRDLKPQNVLLDELGNAHLTDFGIAKLLDATTALTQSGAAIGTPAYMPPEQWRGEAVDARSDIYAFGVMLFEMLTGQLPYRAETPYAFMHQHLNQSLPSVRSLRPDLPPSLEAVLNKTLAKNPDERYGSADQVVNAFRNSVQPQPEPVTASAATRDALREGPTWVESFATTVQPTVPARKPARWWIPLLGVGLIVVIGGAALALRNTPDVQVTVSAAATQFVAVQVTETPTATNASTSTSVPKPTSTTIPPTQAPPTSTVTPQKPSATSSPTLSPTPLPSSTATYTVTIEPTVSSTAVPPTLLPTNTPGATAVAMITGPLPVYSGHTGWITSVAFSPDEQYVLTGSRDYSARLWDMRTGTTVRTFAGHKGALLSVAFSPDGKTILTASEDATARLWDTATGQLLKTLNGNGGQVFSAVFSPNGQYITTGSQDGTARLWDTNSGQMVRSFGPNGGWVIGVAFSPDGQYVLTGSADYKLRLWETATGTLVKTFTGHTGAVRSVAFSADGKYIVSTSTDHTARRWDVQNGTELNRYEGHTDWVFSAVFSPDGKYVLTGSKDNTARLWNAQTGESIAIYRDHTGWVSGVAFSPDGHYSLTGSGDMTARLWEVKPAA